MKKYEIWSEGYLCTGMEGIPEKAFCFGTEEGETFKDACIKFFLREERHKVYFDSNDMTYWGCRLFDNEVDARKSYG